MKTLTIILLNLLILSSCSVYIPNGVNAPMFSKKGEAQIGGNVGSGLNLQAASAFTDHFAIIANGYFNKSTTTINNDDTREGNGKLFEAGLGYYNKSKNGMAFETFVGGGFGNLKIDKNVVSTKSNKTFETSATKLFIQPTLGYSTKHFEFGFTPRWCMLNFAKPKTTYSAAELKSDKFVDIDQTNWMFIEPTFTIRGGGQKFKAQLQFGRSFKLNKEDLGYSAGILNLGIVFKFGGK